MMSIIHNDVDTGDNDDEEDKFLNTSLDEITKETDNNNTNHIKPKSNDVVSD